MSNSAWPAPQPYQRVPGFLEQEVGFLVASYGYTEEQAYYEAIEHMIFNELLELTKRRICKVKGHDIRDESYGGPESGCMAGSCKRCGWSFKTILY